MRFFSLKYSRFSCIVSVSFGAIVGCLAGILLDEPFLSVMRRALDCPVSIVCCSIPLFFPFVCSIIAAFLGNSTILIGISFLKTCGFTFCLTCICMLIQAGECSSCLLLMFSDLCAMPVYCWYWLHSLSYRSSSRWILLLSILLAFIGFMDYLFISPLLVWFYGRNGSRICWIWSVPTKITWAR